MKLLEHAVLTGTIRLKSGLHIGTGEEVGKGEPFPVMKSLRPGGYPYIPGSSLKGKMRYLFEITYGRQKTEDEGSPCSCGKCQICYLFGSGSTRQIYEPSRLIFRDSYLAKNFEDKFVDIGLEEKTGIRVDRVTGSVSRGALFNIQRVPEGFEFSFEIATRIFDTDDKQAIHKWISTGLYLMEQDTLGSAGTRGSGYIEFDNLKFDGKNFDKDWREQVKKDKSELLNIKIK